MNFYNKETYVFWHFQSKKVKENKVCWLCGIMTRLYLMHIGCLCENKTFILHWHLKNL